mgnify:CR=1 FL=1
MKIKSRVWYWLAAASGAVSLLYGMGIEGGAIEVVGNDVQKVTVDLINRMQEEEEGDTLTILAGEDLDDDAFQSLLDAIEEAQPDLEIDSHRGEQPLYPVVFSIE